MYDSLSEQQNFLENPFEVDEGVIECKWVQDVQFHFLNKLDVVTKELLFSLNVLIVVNLDNVIILYLIHSIYQ